MTDTEVVNAARGQYVVCRRYTKPAATSGGILIPHSWNLDTTHTIFEVVGLGQKGASGETVTEALGHELRPDDILRVAHGTPIPVPNTKLFLIWHGNIQSTWRWKDEGIDV
jgi:hypothetical protein